MIVRFGFVRSLFLGKSVDFFELYNMGVSEYLIR